MKSACCGDSGRRRLALTATAAPRPAALKVQRTVSACQKQEVEEEALAQVKVMNDQIFLNFEGDTTMCLAAQDRGCRPGTGGCNRPGNWQDDLRSADSRYCRLQIARTFARPRTCRDRGQQARRT